MNLVVSLNVSDNIANSDAFYAFHKHCKVSFALIIIDRIQTNKLRL